MQKELFRDYRVEEETSMETVGSQDTHPSFFERIRIVLTLDKIILWALVNITAIVFTYSFGIEQGMKLEKAGSAPVEMSVTEPVAAKEAVSSVQESTDEPYVEASREEKGAISSSPAEPGSAVKNKTEVPAAATTAKGAVMPQSGFTIQLITYKREDQAQQEVDRLTKKGLTAFVIPSGKFHQVCVEMFDQKVKASQKLTSLQNGGFSKLYQGAYVRPLKR